MLPSEPGKVMMVAVNPGGIRALLPLLPQLPRVVVLTLRSYAPLFADVVSEEKMEWLEEDLSRPEIHKIMRRHAPGLLVTGTSIPESPGGFLENKFRQCARALKTPSLSVLDHWFNYALRFSSDSHHPLDSLPDLICVMDNRAKEEMIAEGIPASRLCITGQPAFDRLLKEGPDYLKSARASLRKSLHLTDEDFLVGFVSEPVLQDHGRVRGYDEFEVLKKLLHDSILTSSLSQGRPVHLAIKFHPREYPGKYTQLLRSCPSEIICHVVPEMKPWDFLAVADKVIGLTSILLFEAALLGRSAISFQPNLPEGHSCERVITPVLVVREADQVRAWLGDVTPSVPVENYRETKATEKVLTVMNGLLRNADPSEEEDLGFGRLGLGIGSGDGLKLS